MVCADEVAPVLPAAAHRPGARPVAGLPLCGPRFLTHSARRAQAAPRLPRCAASSNARQGRRLRPGRRDLARRHRRSRRQGCPTSSPRVSTARWTGCEQTLARRGDPRTLWPEVRSIIVLAMNYGPAHDPLAVLDKQGPRRDLGLCAEPRLSRHHQGQAQGRRRQARGEGRLRRQGLRRYRAGHGKAAGRGRRHRLAGQAHQSGQPRARLLAVPRHDLHHRRSRTPTQPRPTIAAPAAPASMPARPTPFPRPTGSTPAAASPTSPSRTRVPIPHEFREAIGNRIYGCDDCLAACPWNKFARTASEAKLKARDDLREPPLADLLALDDAGFRAPVLRLAGQAHRPRPVHAKRADRGRQFGRPVAGRALRGAARRRFAAGARRGRLGARPIARARTFQGPDRRPERLDPVIAAEFHAAIGQ